MLRVLWKLAESGVVESAGDWARRTYMLDVKVNRRSSKVMGNVRQSDIRRIRDYELIIKLIPEQKSVSTYGSDGTAVL